MNRSIYLLLLLIFLGSCQEKTKEKKSSGPNFLFCLADDWSYPHAGIYGDKIVKTPNFDRIAREDYLFMNAFTASPSCSPSRAAILSGQEMWRLEEGSLLFGALSKKIPVYTHLLKDKGYEIAHTGKGYGPADLKRGGWDENPAGTAFQAIEKEVPEGIRSTDYAANFEAFMESRDPNKAFCFWYGASEPHRRYEYGIGAKNGYDLDQIKVPGFLPDAEETRNDVADYYYEVEWFDNHLGKMIAYLEEKGLLENTVIVVTSDNGMPFPRAKSTLYNYGTHMPLAIRWGKSAEKGKIIQNPVSLSDVAPTFLDLAQVPIPEEMTGQSLAPLLIGEADEAPRSYVVSGLERHTIARPENKGYPMRSIHTRDLSYVYNFEPERWPVGAPDFDAWPQGFYGDVDGGASKTLFMEKPDKWKELFELSFGKRPVEELFFRKDDPFQLRNLADLEEHTALKKDLQKQLFDYLQKTRDPRMKGLSPWDAYPFAGGDEWEK
ncbi:MAG: sulfatase [Bacteroidia bacterium]|nr:sulfatase [Bacteroidia bacterium]